MSEEIKQLAINYLNGLAEMSARLAGELDALTIQYADSVEIERPKVTLPVSYPERVPSGPISEIKSLGREEIIVENISIKGDGTQTGIRIVVDAEVTKRVIIRNVDIDGTADAIVVQAYDNGAKFEEVRIENAKITNVWNAKNLEGSAIERRCQGVYVENASLLTFADIFGRSIGYNTEEGQPPSAFNHLIYVHKSVDSVGAFGVVGYDIASNGFRVNEENVVTCGNVVIAGAGISFGIHTPDSFENWSGNYSIAPHNMPLWDYNEEPAVRQWHDHADGTSDPDEKAKATLGELITRIDEMPDIDWDAVENDPDRQWYGAVHKQLVAKGVA